MLINRSKSVEPICLIRSSVIPSISAVSADATASLGLAASLDAAGYPVVVIDAECNLKFGMLGATDAPFQVDLSV